MNPSYVLPDSTELQSLEFDWDPYDKVWFYGSSRSFEESTDWFARHLPDAGNTNPDAGKLEFYFTMHGTLIGAFLSRTHAAAHR